MQINELRKIDPKIIAIGSHRPIIQSMLDFDFLSGKKEASVIGIIAAGRRYERYFFGKKEILIPVFDTLKKIPKEIKEKTNLFFNTTSARRAKQSTIDAFETLPQLLGGTIFAEDVPEKHSISMYEYIHAKNKFIVGPASVGFIIPGVLKLGAIGGTDYRLLITADVMTQGSVAVLSASGGMVNEIIGIVAQHGKHLSFALSFGGDRFPTFTPREAFLAAEADPQTKYIIYYGELGGTDEYDIVELISSKQLTKPIITYIAGTVSELFESPPQFGHAKAMAKSQGESAREKREILKKAGLKVAETFTEFVSMVKEIPTDALAERHDYSTMIQIMSERKPALITSTLSGDVYGDATILGENLLSFTQQRSFAAIVASMFLGKKSVSKKLESFVDLVLRLAVDHGPYVSGAMNTIVTARAGKDLVSSLASGLLTIGPRFGGAINQAAANWLKGITTNQSPYDFVEDFASKKIYIQGIGHKKYRIDLPDPRVKALLEHGNTLDKKRFTNFALEVQKITTAKKGNLILNVDGAIAAVLLDILSEKENLSDDELLQLTQNEFFNSLFVLSRSVGFIAHFLDQKRLDEGLFRLPDDLVTDGGLIENETQK